LNLATTSSGDDDSSFEKIAAALLHRSWVVVPDAMPAELTEALFAQVRAMTPEDFAAAGVGRSHAYTLNSFIRRDEIRWIDGSTTAEQAWLDWAARLQRYLNRRLYLGLFSFESHFAHYGPGAFYKKHLDAFRADEHERGARRVLSLVAYLNPGWQSVDGGELVIYDEQGDSALQRVMPAYGTVAVFLSDQVPHEVAAARRDRYSIAGWFRVNGSCGDRADPPQ
jgi:SM-20-related protein